MTRTAKIGAALLMAVAVIAAARVAGRSSRRRALTRRLTAAAARLATHTRSAATMARDTTYQCQCGQRFRLAGRDRHRIYWVEGAAPDEPLVSVTCPNCDRPLPAA